MKSGRMKDRVVLLRPTVTTDAYGAETTSYTAAKTIWAEVQYKDASTSQEVGEFFMDQRIDVLIRDQHEIGEKWRIRQLTGLGNLFYVRNIVPDRLRQMNRLICERVNE